MGFTSSMQQIQHRPAAASSSGGYSSKPNAGAISTHQYGGGYSSHSNAGAPSYHNYSTGHHHHNYGGGSNYVFLTTPTYSTPSYYSSGYYDAERLRERQLADQRNKLYQESLKRFQERLDKIKKDVNAKDILNALKNIDPTWSSNQRDLLLKTAKQQILQLQLTAAISDQPLNSFSDPEIQKTLKTHRGTFSFFYGGLFSTKSSKINTLISSGNQSEARDLWNIEQEKLLNRSNR